MLSKPIKPLQPLSAILLKTNSPVYNVIWKLVLYRHWITGLGTSKGWGKNGFWSCHVKKLRLTFLHLKHKLTCNNLLILNFSRHHLVIWSSVFNMTQSLKYLKCSCKPLCVDKGIHVLYLYPLTFLCVLEKY